jgi:hypothetical protein
MRTFSQAAIILRVRGIQGRGGGTAPPSSKGLACSNTNTADVPTAHKSTAALRMYGATACPYAVTTRMLARNRLFPLEFPVEPHTRLM